MTIATMMAVNKDTTNTRTVLREGTKADVIVPGNFVTLNGNEKVAGVGVDIAVALYAIDIDGTL
jgi:hypothetical protein